MNGAHPGKQFPVEIRQDLGAFEIAVQGRGDGGRLFVNFLGHEVAETAAIGAVGRDRGNAGRALGRPALTVDDIDAVAPDFGNVAVFEVDHLLGQRYQRGGIRGQEMLADADADHQRATLAHAPDAIRMLGVQYRQRKAALQLLRRRADGLACRSGGFQVMMNQVADDLGVGFRIEAVTFGFQRRLDLLMVFDDPVVDYRDSARGDVRMGVGFAGAAMRRPARMGNADLSGVAVVQDPGQRRDLADGAFLYKLRAGVDERQPGRVVTAVLQSAQAVDQQRHHIALGDGRNNSAHIIPSSALAGKPK